MDEMLDDLETAVNSYLINVRELEYHIVHFIKKSNKSTALNVRNQQRLVVDSGKLFKTLSIKFFEGMRDDETPSNAE